MRRLSAVALAIGCSWWCAYARAQEAGTQAPESPDLEFLEYLGSWAEDDEWLELEELRKRHGVGARGRSKGAEEDNGDEDEDE